MTGLNPIDFRDYVVVPTLKYLDPDIPYSDGAVEQVLGTGLAESHLCRLVQVGGGPALGVYQIEPATHEDCWAHWMLWQPGQLYQKVTNLEVRGIGLDWTNARHLQLQTNLAYATAICRIVYRRSPLPLPPSGDRHAQGVYWCDAYNKGGAATPEHYVQAWREAGL